MSRALSLRSAGRFQVRWRVRTRCRSRAKCPELSVMVLGGIGHHMIRIELCSASSRLSLRSTLRASALTKPARSSKVALMRWPMKPVASFRIDPSSRPAYVEDLVGAIAHPLRSRIRRGALQLPPSGQRCSFLCNNLSDRAALPARSLRRLHVTRIAVGVTPASALNVHWRAGPGRRPFERAPSTTRIVMLRVRGGRYGVRRT